ncbi:hypothetical protein PMKS-001221 [Pichia membranifaciens]|uniref:Zn(2)-C6 fungal-type domain-containing protein n=1 Tax=Pichia membranifaciens TaxID=4926 RepID=A0A1Q2YEE2_9ASCO|nr:hypothetical protein PMKS-001221 [Pichia membranifaciens]
MNHYYSYRQQNGSADQPQPLGPPQPPSQQQQASTAQPNPPKAPASVAKKPSKLDVLIQTATSVDLDSFLPSTISSNEKKRKLSSSFNLEYLCNQAEKELNSSCSYASSSSSSPSSSSSSSLASASELSKLQNQNGQQFKRANKKSNRKNSTSTKGSKAGPHQPNQKPTPPLSADPNQQQQPSASSAYPAAPNPLAIKLASPSTHTKRQRSGPSCDCCRSRKIKCDSEIFILSALDTINLAENVKPKSINSHIAHCDFISINPKSGYQYYKIIKDEEHALNNKLTSFNYLQFKPCSACMSKKLKCCFSKGFTRNDIIKFNKTEKMNGSSTNLPFSSATPTADSSVLPSPSTSMPASPPSSSASTSSTSIPTSAFPSSQTCSFSTSIPDNGSLSTIPQIHVKQLPGDSPSIPTPLKSISSALPTPSPTPAVLDNNSIPSSSSNAATILHPTSSSSSSAPQLAVSNGMAVDRTLIYTPHLRDSSSLEIVKHESQPQTQPQFQPQFGKFNEMLKLPKSTELKDKEKEKERDKERKSSKKTSCKTCRFKKIKCVKVDGSDRCVYCNKKSICCLFE